MTSVIMAVVYAVVSRSEVTGLSQPTQCQHVHDSVEDASRLLGLEGVAVQRVELDPFGGRVVHVVTADEAAAACPSCGATKVTKQLSVPAAHSSKSSLPVCDTPPGGGCGRPQCGTSGCMGLGF